MTYRRAANTVEAVLTEVLKSITDAELARFVGKERGYLMRCANPMDRRSLSLQDAIALDRVLAFRGEAPRFMPLMERLIWAAQSEASAKGVRPEDLAARLLVTLGDLQAAVGRLSEQVVAIATDRRPPEKAAEPDRRREASSLIEQIQDRAAAVGDALRRVGSAAARNVAS